MVRDRSGRHEGRRRRTPWLIAGALALSLLVGGGLAVLWWRDAPRAAKGTAAPPRAGGAAVYTTGSGVLFNVDAADLRPDAEAILQSITAKIAASGAKGKIRVEGYTDDAGSDQYNDSLSSQRAENVATWLVRHGIPRTRISVYYYGERSPAVANDTDEHRQANRRVEIVVEP